MLNNSPLFYYLPRKWSYAFTATKINYNSAFSFFFLLSLPFALKSQIFKWPHVPQMVRINMYQSLHVYYHADHTWTNKPNNDEFSLKIDYCSVYFSPRSPYTHSFCPPMASIRVQSSTAKYQDFDALSRSLGKKVEITRFREWNQDRSWNFNMCLRILEKINVFTTMS